MGFFRHHKTELGRAQKGPPNFFLMYKQLRQELRAFYERRGLPQGRTPEKTLTYGCKLTDADRDWLRNYIERANDLANLMEATAKGHDHARI